MEGLAHCVSKTQTLSGQFLTVSRCERSLPFEATTQEGRATRCQDLVLFTGGIFPLGAPEAPTSSPLSTSILFTSPLVSF